MDKENKKKSNKIIRLLADYQGVDVGDISNEDTLIDDLHMSPSNITDFMEKLYSEGYDTDQIDLTDVNTVGDLVELLNSEEEL